MTQSQLFSSAGRGLNNNISKWFNEDILQLKKDIDAAFLALEGSAGGSTAEVHSVPGGIPATTATPGKLINGLGFGTTLADITVTVGGVAQTVNSVTNTQINYDQSDLGLTAGDVVVVLVKKAGILVGRLAVATI